MRELEELLGALVIAAALGDAEAAAFLPVAADWVREYEDIGGPP